MNRRQQGAFDRAEKAMAAFDEFWAVSSIQKGTEDDLRLSSALTDLHHWAEAKGVSFSDALETSLANLKKERSE
jgi:hypothetical protein